MDNRVITESSSCGLLCVAAELHRVPLTSGFVVVRESAAFWWMSALIWNTWRPWSQSQLDPTHHPFYLWAKISIIVVFQEWHTADWINKKDQSCQRRDEGRCMVWSVNVCGDVSSVCLGTVPLCNHCLLSLCSGIHLFTISPEWLGKQTAHLLMSSSVEYARCIHERERGRGKEVREGEREHKVNLSKSLLYGVQTESDPPQWPY